MIHDSEQLLGRLADIKRTTAEGRDARIFLGWYAPVMVMENGRTIVKPMRYQCRSAGRPAFYDKEFPGTYNARRDNLEGFWIASGRTVSISWQPDGNRSSRGAELRRVCCRDYEAQKATDR